ncbi:MAG: protein kinase, partial [bacterium]|nr:protein kinase [bacterium]
MVQIPDELAQVMVAGDCVLWAGAGFGALAGRPGWSDLCARLAEEFPKDKAQQLQDLLEQGRLRTVLSYVHRHLGDEPLHDLLTRVSEESTASELPDGAADFAELRWKACFATTYSDVLCRILAGAGSAPDVISHTDVHGLSLRGAKDMFILRTPPTGRSMRADKVFFELVEEAVRSRTFLFLGFDIDDPDLYQILELFSRVGRGNTHYALFPFVTDAESEELFEAYGIKVVPVTGEVDLALVAGELRAACGKVTPRPSQVDVDLAKLDLARALRGVETRADLAMDFALGLDLRELEWLVDQVPGTLTGVDPSTLLRAGCVFLAHERLEPARRCFQQVVSRGAGAEYQNIARFNLAFASFMDGDAFAAVQGINAASEADRALAVVPPRFEIVEILGRDGTRAMFSCRDRETGEHLDISVAILERPVSRHQQQRFYDEVQRLIPVEHEAIKKVRGGFADGRLFGVMSEPAPGFVLEEAIRDEKKMPLDRAVELLTPVLGGLGACHEQGIVHRNVTPRQIIMTPDGSMLRGFGPPPVMSYHRSSVRHALDGYAAPEVLAGAEPTPASDVYAVGAVLYRCLTGEVPAGSVPRPTKIYDDLDPRLNGLIETVLNPDPAQRPPAAAFAAFLGEILATPAPAQDADSASRPQAESAPTSPAPMAAAPAAVAAPTEEYDEIMTPPAGLRIVAPEDPDDLEGWAWILERKPTHIEAREAIERIEQRGRDEGQWDKVADVLQVRAQHVQVQHERVELLRELAELFERELGAPANAFATLQALIEDVPVPMQLELIDDLVRLGGLSGNWSQLAESITIVAGRAPDADRQAGLYAELGHVYAEQLGAPDRALSAYEHASELQPESHEHMSRLPPFYRKFNRDAELAAALLTLAEMETGSDRAAHLLEASEVLQSALEDEEGAFAALEALYDEEPDYPGTADRIEGLARSLGRHDVLVDVLSRRADAALDDAAAADLGHEVAALALEKLGDPGKAIEEYRKVLERRREDDRAARNLVQLLRNEVAAEPARRAELVDALHVLAELASGVDERVAVLAERASLLDLEPDEADQAAECREQIVSAVGAAHAAGQDAAARLEKYYRAIDAYNALAELLRKQARAKDLEGPQRVAAWSKILELSRGKLGDETSLTEALEALVELDPGNTDCIDELLARYLDAGEFERAGPLVRTRVDAEEDPKKKADLLIKGASLREQIGKTELAIAAFEEALMLDDTRADGWIGLRDLYQRNQQPLKAIDALVAAANATGNRLERTKMLFEAAHSCLELDEPVRANGLLEQVVELDPDHGEATELLLERLLETEELERAWPVAQTFVLQARAQTPDDQRRNLRALSAAGRCALVVGEPDKAREYL